MRPEFYQVLHISSLLTMAAAIGAILLSDRRSKLANVLLGLSSLLVFVAGFGLMAKLGYPTNTQWILIKLVIWLLIAAIVPIVAKRFPQAKTATFFAVLGLLIVAASFAYLKP